MCFSYVLYEDVMEKMVDFVSVYFVILGELLGFIVCVKLLSCGMECVWLYDEKGNCGCKEGVGLFIGVLMVCYLWLLVEEDGWLYDLLLWENFVECVFVLYEFNVLCVCGLMCYSLLVFYSCYKLQLLVYYQVGYWEIGLFVVLLYEWEDLEVFFEVYCEKLMVIFKQFVLWKNYINVLMYIQGYFCDQLNSCQCGELWEVIFNYCVGLLLIFVLLMLFKYYLVEYLDCYLQVQNYFDFYLQDLVLCLMVN